MDPISIIKLTMAAAQLVKAGAEMAKDVKAQLALDPADKVQLDNALRELREANDQLYESVQAKLSAASSRG